MKIFISGSLQNIEKKEDLCKKFVERLGQLVVLKGHTLLNGCRGSLDKVIAESAASVLADNEQRKKLILAIYLKAKRVGRCIMRERSLNLISKIGH